MALPLIDKQDNFEVVRDQLGQLLANEIANQKALAVGAGKDPALWDIKIYIERTNPVEQYLNENPDPTPIANIWFDSESFDKSRSDVVERQTTIGTFNIDIFGYGVASENGTGQKVSDKQAGLEAQRAIRLIRNILMAAENIYLQLPRGTAWDRFPLSITIFQPEIDNRPIQNIRGARIVFNVTYNEFSPQVTGENLEYLSIDIKRANDGQVIAEADFDYTT